MRAVFLLQTDPFHPKPALRALREAETLRDWGWDVSFVAWIKSEAPPPQGPSAFRVRRVHAPVPLLGEGLLRRGLAFLRATRDLATAATDEAPDLLVAHDFEVLRAAVAAKRAARVPLVYDSHEDWPALIAENSAREARIAGWQERRLAKRVDHVITVSEPIGAKFRGWKCETTVLYSARPTSEIHLADREGSRKALGYEDGDFVVGFAGALGPGRGLEVLLETLARLPDSVKVLVVGGPAEELEGLRALAANRGVAGRVRLDPYRPFAELAPHYAAMDVGVILLDDRPNHRRALPNKLFDYMGHRVASVVPDYPVLGSLVREHQCGWTVDRVDADSLAQVLRRAQSSGEASRRGERGRTAYLEHFAWELQEATLRDVVAKLKFPAPSAAR
ncbi:MAG: hypothetical protein A3K59_02650 [Euryarchaeota archaeon RBG_19FT_COMBO_69_17]|nr:MAG: hypothetical protein A3K59_02650 [Euryarchaeota archaeon RBG_19FT_COMBO_69_17]